MATKGTRAPTTRKGNVPDYQYPVPNVPVDANSVPRQDWKSVMGWIAACVLVALLLPLMGMVYLDNLTTTTRAEKALERLEKLERKIERKERDKDRSNISDNPVFDRVRRPLSLSVPRSQKLGND